MEKWRTKTRDIERKSKMRGWEGKRKNN